MPRGINNWTFRDIEAFLKERGFALHHTNGSHFYYIAHIEKAFRQVCVPYHGSRSIKPRTMKAIITQSGIAQKEWMQK